MLKQVKFKDLLIDSGFVLTLSGREQFCIKTKPNSFWCKAHGDVVMGDKTGFVEADDSRIKPWWKLW